MSATHVFHLPGYPASVKALCADGVTRTARPSGNGQADTYFSIPAYVVVSVTEPVVYPDGSTHSWVTHRVRRQVAGYISPADDGDGYQFRAYTYRKNGHLIPDTRKAAA